MHDQQGPPWRIQDVTFIVVTLERIRSGSEPTRSTAEDQLVMILDLLPPQGHKSKITLENGTEPR